MAALVWDLDGHEPIAQYGTYIGPDGAAHSLEGADIALTASDSWTSPTTGAVYPMGWRLDIGSLAVSVDLDPVQRDAEFGDSSYAPAAYWEGAVSVTGQACGAAALPSSSPHVSILGESKSVLHANLRREDTED